MTDTSQLEPWRRHYTAPRDGTGLTHLVVVGDSLPWGGWASTPQDAWPNVLRRALNTLAGLDPAQLSDGHVHAGSHAEIHGSPPSLESGVVFGPPYWSTVSGSPTDAAKGLGVAGWQMPASSSVSCTVTARRVLINYRKQNVAGTSALTVTDSVNGTLGTITCLDGTQPANDGTNAGLWDSGDLGANVSRTITVTAGAGAAGAVFLGGYFLGNQHGREVCVWNGGHPALSTQDWFDDPQMTDIASALSALSSGRVDLIAAIGSADALVPPYVDPADTASNLAATIARVRAQVAVDCTVVACIPARPAPHFVPTATWAPWRQAVQAAATAAGAYTIDDEPVLSAGNYRPDDDIHLNDTGHQAVAAARYAALKATAGQATSRPWMYPAGLRGLVGREPSAFADLLDLDTKGGR